MPQPGPLRLSLDPSSVARQKNEEPGGEPGSSTMHFSRELLLVPVVPADQRPLDRLGRESLGWQFLEQLYAVVLARLMHVW